MTDGTVAEAEPGIAARRPAPLRIAVLGGGAAAELCHLPALARATNAVVSAIVDRNLQRAQSLAARLPCCNALTNVDDALDGADAVVNALPHDLHAPVSIECLRRGISVLVEKPMARTAAEAHEMIEAGDRSGAVLQVGLMYRFCDGPRLLKHSIDSGRLGEIHGFSLEWGGIYDWPVQSGFFFDRQRAGGGVLIDTGSHALDLVSWLLGPVEVADYADDAVGGVEADCEIVLRGRSLTGRFTGSMALSRVRSLSNLLTIHARHWVVSYDVNTPDHVWWRVTSPNTTELATQCSLPSPGRQSWPDVYASQIAHFIESVNGGVAPVVADLDAMAGVRLIDACYARRRTLRRPWEEPKGDAQ